MINLRSLNRANLVKVLLVSCVLLLLLAPYIAICKPTFLVGDAQSGLAPHHSHHIILVSQVESTNWGGYVVASSFSSPQPIVTAVHGSWIVQAVQPSSSATYSAQWIGIGGYFSSDSSLIQTGTESDSSSGSTTYNAWYELLPNSETAISSLTISPGDKIDASVVCSGSCTSATQGWTITVKDVTTGQQFTTTQSYSSSLKSAEWIEERPETCFGPFCSLTTLANFGTAYYGQDYTSVSNTGFATIGSQTSAIGSFPNNAITMVDSSGSTLAQPSSLSSDGSSFTMSYGSQGTTTSSTTTTTTSSSTTSSSSSTTTTTTTSSSSTTTSSSNSGHHHHH